MKACASLVIFVMTILGTVLVTTKIVVIRVTLVITIRVI